ncbi:MAG: 1-deoxy-D-xylulose-5-phosphate reductoisomerase, partial [Clostridia bacterium]|nr:1-deoxy-D-xylulose-5-phosphate reductoisomerase [Clostridia bacterium]
MREYENRRIALLGSTGSIGTQTLDVARCLGLEVPALAARRNIKLLEEQIREFKPQLVAVMEHDAAQELRVKVADMPVRVVEGMEGFEEVASFDCCDTVLNAVVGMVGLRPTMAAINAGKRIALANKETLVAGGALVTNAASAKGVSIIPVDSEHSAIFQCLQSSPGPHAFRKIILTASGGPFFGKTADELRGITKEQALKHPNWTMGAKITIDSATLMNKGLEVIEAAWLFDKSVDDIEVVVHRESIIHSAVEFCDCSVIAQLGLPDMRIPIQYAISYPDRAPSPAKPLDLFEIGEMHFARPDTETFRCLEICREAMRRGG